MEDNRLEEEEDKIFLVRQLRREREDPKDGYFGIPVHRLAWSVITWNAKEKQFQVDKFDKEDKMLPYPKSCGHFAGSATVLFKSRLFFISGSAMWRSLRTMYSPLVYSFGLDSLDWLKHSNIKTPRCFHTAVAVGNCIYVFGNNCHITGCCRSVNSFVESRFWGEMFDTKNKKNSWRYLPKPPRELHQLHQPRAYAVYHNCSAFYYNTTEDEIYNVEENQNLILFPLYRPCSPICVFSCTTNHWLPTIRPDSSDAQDPYIYPYCPTNTQDRLVVVHGVLLWHRTGSIYGYDLINRKYLGSLFTVPLDPEQNANVNQPRDPPMFLLHQGDDMLFLFFQDQCNKFITHCHKFRIQKGKQGQESTSFHLLHQVHSSLSTETNIHESLLDVLPLSEVLDNIEEGQKYEEGRSDVREILY